MEENQALEMDLATYESRGSLHISYYAQVLNFITRLFLYTSVAYKKEGWYLTWKWKSYIIYQAIMVLETLMCGKLMPSRPIFIFYNMD